MAEQPTDPFCPRHGRASRPTLTPGLRCDCEANQRAAMGYPIERGYDQVQSPKPATACDVAEEIVQARRKFPGNRHLLAALVEEVGELAQAYLQRQPIDQVRKEALQVACVALRIYEEGDSVFADLTDAEAKP